MSGMPSAALVTFFIHRLQTSLKLLSRSFRIYRFKLHIELFFVYGCRTKYGFMPGLQPISRTVSFKIQEALLPRRAQCVRLA